MKLTDRKHRQEFVIRLTGYPVDCSRLVSFTVKHDDSRDRISCHSATLYQRDFPSDFYSLKYKSGFAVMANPGVPDRHSQTKRRV